MLKTAAVSNQGSDIQRTPSNPTTISAPARCSKIASDNAEIYTAFWHQKQLLTVSVGGLQDSFVTYCSWKLVNRELRVIFEGSGPVDGHMLQSGSTRVELFGLGSPLAYICEYSLFYRVPIQGKIKWICDNQVALTRVEKTIPKNSKCQSQPNKVDIISFIADELQSLHQPFLSWCIKTTSNDTIVYLHESSLTLAGANRLATHHRETSTHNHLCQHIDHFPTTNINLGDFNETRICHHVNGTYLHIYFCKIKGWKSTTYKSIDWYMFGQHMKKVG